MDAQKLNQSFNVRKARYVIIGATAFIILDDSSG